MLAALTAAEDGFFLSRTKAFTSSLLVCPKSGETCKHGKIIPDEKNSEILHQVIELASKIF